MTSHFSSISSSFNCRPSPDLRSVVKTQRLLLCTLLIGNSLAMESLPIFLDKLMPPWAAILVSATLIIMFGEEFMRKMRRNISSIVVRVKIDC
ncbi:hypothetical protein CASFOL_016834 [Castilleja foliolosa]|uniref:CNNM transmembrane domain-containing protein n=1 Tax=Castilleja foliolosa TaxID=1961234 RepID=A0ABD3DDP7_9LAMI